MGNTDSTYAVAFTCVGRRIELIQAFRSAFRKLRLKGSIVGFDRFMHAPAMHVCDAAEVVCEVAEDRYIPMLLDTCARHKVQLLVPTTDRELQKLADARQQFADIGCTVLVSSPEVINICQDKLRTFEFLRDAGFDTPDTCSAQEALARTSHNWPYFLKPRDGSASQRLGVARSLEELRLHCRREPDCIVQPYITGTEYTVDVLADLSGAVRCVVPRRRYEVRWGEVSKGITVKHRTIMQQSTALVQALRTGPGVITIQCFWTHDNRVVFIEINPRFGGGAPLSIRAGADFPRWIMQWQLGRHPRVQADAWEDGLMMLRYDQSIWVRAGDLGITTDTDNPS